MPRPLTFPIKKLIGFNSELWKQVQEYRFAARLNTESDAVRHLIELGLQRGKSGPGGSTPGSARKPGSPGKTATPRKPGRQAIPAQSKEAQIRALREQGAG